MSGERRLQNEGNRGCMHARDIEYRISDVPNARKDGIYPRVPSGICSYARETQRRKWRSNETGILEPVLRFRRGFRDSTCTSIRLIELPTRTRQGIGDESTGLRS